MQSVCSSLMHTSTHTLAKFPLHHTCVGPLKSPPPPYLHHQLYPHLPVRCQQQFLQSVRVLQLMQCLRKRRSSSSSSSKTKRWVEAGERSATGAQEWGSKCDESVTEDERRRRSRRLRRETKLVTGSGVKGGVLKQRLKGE